VVEEVATGRRKRRFSLDGAVPGGVLRLGGELAKALAGEPARPPGIESEAALQAYGEAVTALDAAARDAALVRALDASPGSAVLVQANAEILAGRGERDAARRLVEERLGRGGLDEVARSRLALLAAELGGEAAKKAEALDACSRAVPLDTELLTGAGRAWLETRRYAQAAERFRRAAALEPSRGEVWNLAAYAEAYAGNLAGALGCLEQYRKADPASPNVLDSTGEIRFRFAQYEEAGKAFGEVHRRQPDFQGGAALAKAALCRLMLGDADGADAQWRQYSTFRRDVKDAAVPFLDARWRYWTGRRDAAVREMSALAPETASDAGLAAAARLELAAWAVLGGDRRAAREHLRAAFPNLPARPLSPAGAMLAVLAEDPAPPAEWRKRVEEAFPRPVQGALRKRTLAYALLLDGHFGEAAPLLREAVAAAGTFGGGEEEVALAWALLETGETAEAARILAVNPVIQPGEESPMFPLVLPRILYLRGLAAEQSGQTAAARDHYRLFLRYAGEKVRPIGGDTERARRALGR
jgi:tetratricopeptide (TPR) repeat protein